MKKGREEDIAFYASTLSEGFRGVASYISQLAETDLNAVKHSEMPIAKTRHRHAGPHGPHSALPMVGTIRHIPKDTLTINMRKTVSEVSLFEI